MAIEGPNGDLVAISPIYFYKILLGVKCNPFVSKDKRYCYMNAQDIDHQWL